MNSTLKTSLIALFSFLIGGGITYFVVTKYKIEPLCKMIGHGAMAMQLVDLNQALRKLWSDHVFWTRDYIIAAVGQAPDAKAALARLMKNQEDLGHAIGSVYGKAAGDKATQLLKEHISISGDVVKYAMSGEQDKLKEADKRWHDNAVELATFLHSANPENWPYDALLSMLNKHLDLTTQEAVARIKKDWEKDVATFDKVYDEILMMADALTEGIGKQKFASQM